MNLIVYLKEQAFLQDLYHSSFSDVVKIPNAQLALSQFMSVFNLAVHKHAPFKNIRVKARSSPRFTADLNELFNSRKRAWTQARQFKTPAHLLLFRQLRNRCTAALRKAKSNYYLHSFTGSCQNPGTFWKVVKSVSRNNRSFPTHIVLILITECITRIFNLSPLELSSECGNLPLAFPYIKVVTNLIINNYHPMSKLGGLTKVPQSLVNNQLFVLSTYPLSVWI